MDYHRRSVAETAMFRIKTLLDGHLSLRDDDAQVGEAMAMVKALNQMTLLGMPHSVRFGFVGRSQMSSNRSFASTGPG